MTRVSVFALAAIGLCLIFGAALNALANWRLRAQYPVPGKLFTVNGASMHLYCTGAGEPTVIFESGLGDDWMIWQKVQPELARITRVCSYDRAGLGWSDRQSGPWDALAISEQLHSLLRQAGVSGSLVLVGHSAGGLYIRAFHEKYPDEVAGLVFVDATSPEAFQLIPSAQARAATLRKAHRKARWTWVKEATGWQRLSGDCEGVTPGGLEQFASLARSVACRPSFAMSRLGEWDDFELSGEEVAKLPCCG